MGKAMSWMTIITIILNLPNTIQKVKELKRFLDRELKRRGYKGLSDFAEEMGVPVNVIVDYACELLGLDSEGSDDNSDSEESDESATVMCPNCQKFVIADDGNGLYPCPYCKKDIDVGVFDGAFTPQYDNDSSGWAVAEWLIKSFKVPAPSPKAVREQLEDTHEEGEVATPSAFCGFMQTLPLESLLPSNANEKSNIFNSGNGFADFVFEQGGRIAVCFQFAKRGLGRQWVGLEHHGSGVRVMDPIQTNGYYPLAQWHKSMGIGRVIAVYGFTGMNNGIGG